MYAMQSNISLSELCHVWHPALFVIAVCCNVSPFLRCSDVILKTNSRVWLRRKPSAVQLSSLCASALQSFEVCLLLSCGKVGLDMLCSTTFSGWDLGYILLLCLFMTDSHLFNEIWTKQRLWFIHTLLHLFFNHCCCAVILSVLRLPT